MKVTLYAFRLTIARSLKIAVSDFGVMVSFNYFANVQGVPSLQVQARIVEEGLYTNTSVRQSLILNPLGTHCCLHPSSASHHLAVHRPKDYSRQDNKLKVTSPHSALLPSQTLIATTIMEFTALLSYYYNTWLLHHSLHYYIPILLLLYCIISNRNPRALS